MLNYILVVLFVPTLVAMEQKKPPGILTEGFMPTAKENMLAGKPKSEPKGEPKKEAPKEEAKKETAKKTQASPGKDNVEQKVPKKVALSGSVPASVSDAGSVPVTAHVEVKSSVATGKRSIDFAYLIMLSKFVKMPVPYMYDPALAQRDPREFTKNKTTFETLGSLKEFQVLYGDLERQLDIFAQNMEKQLNDEKIWTTGKPGPDFFDLKSGLFTPYIQKTQIPTGSRVYTWGDLHGGFHSLVNMISKLVAEKVIDNNFKITDPRCYLQFLGDFVDRGLFGIEVIYTLLCLKNANPEHVMLVRGNHEELGMNEMCGFRDELKYKLGAKYKEFTRTISGFYNLLPLANEINGQLLCCHGCLDHCYDNRRLRAHPGTLACELISPVTYHPHNVTSKLSDECLAGIADEMIVVARIDRATKLVSQLGPVIHQLENFNHEMSSIGYQDFELSDRENFEKRKQSFDACYASFCVVSDCIEALSMHGSSNSSSDDKIIEKIESLEGLYDAISDDIENIENIASRYLEAGEVDFETMRQLGKYKKKIEQEYSKINLPEEVWSCQTLIDTESVAVLKHCIVSVLKEAKTVSEARIVSKRCNVEYENLPQSLRVFLMDHLDVMPCDLSACGLAWNDVNTDEKGPDILMRDNYRYCLGMRLSREMMKIQGLRAVVRAHQHHGRMAKLLKEHGVVALWGMETGTVLPMKDFSVYTLQVAYSAGSRKTHDPAYAVDIFTCLHIRGEDMSTWRLEKIIVSYGEEKVAVASKPGGPKEEAPKTATPKKETLKTEGPKTEAPKIEV